MAHLQVANTPERGFPVLFQLSGNETIVRIASGVPTLGQACIVTSLLDFHVQDALLVLLSFSMHSLRLKRRVNRQWLDRLQQLPADRGIDPWSAEAHAPWQAHHKVWLVATIYRPARWIARICDAQSPPASPASHHAG